MADRVRSGLARAAKASAYVAAGVKSSAHDEEVYAAALDQFSGMVGRGAHGSGRDVHAPEEFA